MKIIVDTNVVISGTFFGGYPKKILEAVVNNEVLAYASKSIVDEYLEIIDEMINSKQGKITKKILDPFIKKLIVIKPTTKIELSRDSDDDKFIECAVDSKATYIVSGDKDLLDIKKYKNIEIVTAKMFCDKYLK